MDKHYGWQEGRGSQVPAGRAQNGQRWNERYREDDREMRGRGSEHGWDDDSRHGSRDARFVPGADLDREDYTSEGPDDAFGNPRPGQWGQPWQGDRGRWSQSQYGRTRDVGGQFNPRSFRNEPFRERGPNQGFSGGHYGGFANEGYAAQGGYGGRPSNQGSFGDEGRDFSSYGQTFGQGYAGPGATQGYRGQGYGPSHGSNYGQGYSGRGPKGYQRSDERIKEQVSDRLMDDNDIDATEILVDVKNGEVTLTGTVNTRHEKRLAEDAAEQTPGVREVQNHLRIQPQQSWSGRSESMQSSSSAPSKSKSTGA